MSRNASWWVATITAAPASRAAVSSSVKRVLTPGSRPTNGSSTSSTENGRINAEHDGGLLAQATAEAGGQVVGALGEVQEREQLVGGRRADRAGRAGRATYSMCSLTLRSS